MDRFDKDELKTAARGQWDSILNSLCGISQSQLSGKHQPCPKCGGNDRFRMIDKADGALHCNQCFSTKNGDGIAAVCWLLDCDFKTAMHKIGNHLGMKPVKPKKLSKDPSSKLKFVEWNDLLAANWCLKKKPINIDALKKVGARMALTTQCRQQFKVIAIPIWANSPENIVGWNLYNITGGTLPRFNPATKEVSQVKVKLTFGSKPGLMGFIDESQTAYKTEGPTDMLALISICDNASIICNSNGAKQNPNNAFQWLPKALDGKEIRVVHDCDEPGQVGAIGDGKPDSRPGWANWLAGKCENSIVKNILLPYEIEKTHGKDLRDWIADGGNQDLLEELAEVEPTEGVITDGQSNIWEADDDPHRLAQINLSQYKKKYGGSLAFYRDEWWKYKSGRWQKIQTSELKAKISLLIRKEFESKWLESGDQESPVKKVTIGLVANVLNAMASLCSVPSSVSMPCWIPDRKRRNYIAFQNGILDLDAVFQEKQYSEAFIDHSPNWFSAFRLDYKFDHEASCPKWLTFLDEAMENDDDRIDLLQEWAGYLLTNKNDFQKFLILEGEGKNGKTVFFAGMTAMLGEDNVSHVAMENFGGRFDLGVTLGKAANISGDVGEIDNMAEGILKQFTGGDTMQFDRKNLIPVQARPTAKLMAAWNQRPRIKDRSAGLWRRMLLVPFRHSVKEENRIYGMDQPEWWSGESAGIFMWALAGLYRLKTNKRFTKCQVSQDALDEYKLDSNPTAEFFKDNLEPNTDGQVDAKHLFKLYQLWCKESNCRPLGKRQFGKEIKRSFPNVDRVKRRHSGSRNYFYSGVCYQNVEIAGESVQPDDVF